MKYKLIIVLVLGLVLCLQSCAIPLRIETILKDDPSEIIRNESRFEYEKQKYIRERIERKRLAGYNRIERLRDIRLNQKKLLRLPKQEKELILQSFNNSGILRAFEKLEISIFDIAGFLNEYGKTDIDGFCNFLETKYPFSQFTRRYLDREMFILAKRNYKLLNRIK
jgi:hypothetical protein